MFTDLMRRRLFIMMMSIAAGVVGMMMLLIPADLAHDCDTSIEKPNSVKYHAVTHESGEFFIGTKDINHRIDRPRRRPHIRQELQLLIHLRPSEKYDKRLTAAVIKANKMLSNAGLSITRVQIIHDSKYDAVDFDRAGIKDKRVIEMLDAYDADKSGIHVYYIDSIDTEEEHVRVVGMFASFGGYCRRMIVLTPHIDVNTLSHELGHFFGLHHIDDRHNIMHSAVEFNSDRSMFAEFRSWQLNVISRKARKYVDRCLVDS